MTRLLTRPRLSPPTKPHAGTATGMSLGADGSGVSWPLIGLVTIVVAGVLAATAVVLNHGQNRDRVESSGRSPVFTLPTPPAPEILWVSVAGVQVPISRHHGPHITTGHRAAGYSRSPEGAAVAGVNVLVRASPTAGPASFDAVLASQLTGANLPTLRQTTHDQYEQLRLARGIREGEPILEARTAARVRGYIFDGYSHSAGRATVRVVLDSEDLAASGRLVTFRLSLVWDHDDWRVIAPPRGDWGAVASALGSAPSGMLSYDGLG